jgi:polyisoprenoid-binding protein YceI
LWNTGACALLLGAGIGVALPGARARAETLELSPDQTQIRFELDSTLHRVEGTARLLSGEIRFSPEGGATDGMLVVDARSLETGNGMRDETMHAKVLESERYPRIELVPETLTVGPRDGSVWPIVLAGHTRIHGGTWPLEIHAEVTVEGDDLARVHGAFVIPHVAWGMRDMSNFLLSVEKEVHVEFDATGRIAPDSPEHATSSGAEHALGEHRDDPA